MSSGLHPEIRIQRLSVGNEQSPLLVIDNFVANPDELRARAATRPFAGSARYFPGVRAKAPLSYQHLIAEQLKDLLKEFFQLEGGQVRFSMCHYSLVTTPPDRLTIMQRIPHVDSIDRQGLASIHYLFKGSLGGTAFYRHRATGFESIDESRQRAYFNALESEHAGPDKPGSEYINGDTPLFEQIGSQEGVYNRMLIYRRNVLHSGNIDKNFVPDRNPLTGRLSINCFFDVAG
jgi:hypothetical protein